MITITHEQVEAMVAQRVEEHLSPARLDELAAAAIAERIGRLTLDEALPYLQCANVPQLRATCAKYGIPIRKLGNKKQWILLADISEALRKFARVMPPSAGGAGRSGINGTSVGSRLEAVA